jgi:hypothetical protein
MSLYITQIDMKRVTCKVKHIVKVYGRKEACLPPILNPEDGGEK